MVKFDRENNPNAALLTSALRSIGYDNVSAISDILDNSLDAEASVISIHFQEKGSYREIVIVDNGRGMDLQTLDQALRLGSDVDSRNINAELGKFGMGLSTASLSLARRLEVFTKQKDGKLYKSVSDVDEIFKTNKFIKIISSLLDSAELKAYRSEDKKASVSVSRRGEVVYEVIVDLDNNLYTLKHYGTVTIHYNKQTGELISWYGESVSDRDSMNTFMYCVNPGAPYYFRYGPNMGFVLEYNGEQIEVNVNSRLFSVN